MSTPKNDTSQGTVYLIHFDTPCRHARHYTGWALDLEQRLRQHRAGHGARLLEVIAAGIDWTLARTWPGSRQRERQLKRQGGASRRCPICRAHGPAASDTSPVDPAKASSDTSSTNQDRPSNHGGPQ